jgi:hypothetical protein
MIQTVADVQLEHVLNHFDASARHSALVQLLGAGPPPAALRGIANMHCHTFFSFNAYGYSPTGLAWLARQRGYRTAGHRRFRRAGRGLGVSGRLRPG